MDLRRVTGLDPGCVDAFTSFDEEDCETFCGLATYYKILAEHSVRYPFWIGLGISKHVRGLLLRWGGGGTNFLSH